MASPHPPGPQLAIVTVVGRPLPGTAIKHQNRRYQYEQPVFTPPTPTGRLPRGPTSPRGNRHMGRGEALCFGLVLGTVVPNRVIKNCQRAVRRAPWRRRAWRRGAPSLAAPQRDRHMGHSSAACATGHPKSPWWEPTCASARGGRRGCQRVWPGQSHTPTAREVHGRHNGTGS